MMVFPAELFPVPVLPNSTILRSEKERGIEDVIYTSKNNFAFAFAHYEASANFQGPQNDLKWLK